MEISLVYNIPKEFIEVLVGRKYPQYITEVIQMENKPLDYYRSDYISGQTSINIRVEKLDLKALKTKDSEYFKMLNDLNQVLIPYYTIVEYIKDTPSEVLRDHNPLFVIYQASDGNNLQFILNEYEASEFVNDMSKLSEIITKYEERSDAKFNDAIEILHIQEDKKIYFENQSGDWKLIRPLREIANDISEKYYSTADPRSKKPSVLIDRNNLNKKMNIGHNWVLQFKGKDLFMSKPNDVSLYCNISTSNQARAKELQKELKDTLKALLINFPSENQQSSLYDYFELLIQAIIFSYTSIEAFVNIVIPSYYKFTEIKDGVTTIYTKEAIERKFHLREKLKKVLKDILKVEDVTREKWWSDYVELENIRNEFIHSKESKAEERYNKLLNPNIFRIIEVNEKLLRYYGEQIMKSRPDLINEFPVGYGYDETWPGLTTKQGFESSRRVLMNEPYEEE